MSDIYVPIDFSDIKSVIPSGEDIIYSTMCRCLSVIKSIRKTKTIKWNTHVLLTPNGLAYIKPDFHKKKAPPSKGYTLWEEVFGMILIGGKGISTEGVDLNLIRNENFETKEKFETRVREFLIKFPPLIIEKKEQWLKQNLDNPEIKEQRKKFMKSSLYRLKGNYRRILAKEEKRLAKEAKKKK